MKPEEPWFRQLLSAIINFAFLRERKLEEYEAWQGDLATIDADLSQQQDDNESAVTAHPTPPNPTPPTSSRSQCSSRELFIFHVMCPVVSSADFMSYVQVSAMRRISRCANVAELCHHALPLAACAVTHCRNDSSKQLHMLQLRPSSRHCLRPSRPQLLALHFSWQQHSASS